MLPEKTINELLEEFNPIIRSAIKKHVELEYVRICRRKFQLPEIDEKFYVNNHLDYFLYYKKLKNTLYESKFWALQDSIVEMYEDYLNK